MPFFFSVCVPSKTKTKEKPNGFQTWYIQYHFQFRFFSPGWKRRIGQGNASRGNGRGQLTTIPPQKNSIYL